MSAARPTVGAWSSQNELWERLGPPLGIREPEGGRGGGKGKGKGTLSSCVWMTFPYVYLEGLGSHSVFGVHLPCWPM